MGRKPKLLSHANQLLLTAKELTERRETPFTRQQLAIAAWAKWPNSFGFGDSSIYPDTHKVYCLLTTGNDRGGLSGIGVIRNIKGHYELTPEGIQYAKQVYLTVRNRKQKSHDKVIPTQEDQQLVIRLMTDPAHEKVKSGEQLEVTSQEGLAFWGINGDVGVAVTDRMRNLAIVLASLSEQVGENIDLVLDNGLVVSWNDMAALIRTEKWLLAKFRHHIKFLERRKQ